MKTTIHRLVTDWLMAASLLFGSHKLLLGFSFVGAITLMPVVSQAQQPSAPVSKRGPVPFEEYLRATAVPRDVIDRFLSGPAWAQFDPEVGYILSNYLPADGMDGSSTLSTVQPNGARTSFLYAGRKCRINTYGDSFTQCHQVSDGETWQEYLAAHLGEPISNFGMGGFGVYQAYRRMLREERGKDGAEYVILYIWGDDHIRSLLRCRHAITLKFWDHGGGSKFHGNFWAHLEMDLATGRIVEKENLLPTRESLYHMTDSQWMVDHLKDDLALHLYAFARGLVSDLDKERTSRLASLLDCPVDWNEKRTLPGQASQLLDKYSLRATRYILEKAGEFARREKKKLLVILFDPGCVMSNLVAGKPRYDQEIVDYLKGSQMPFFDMNEVHVRDFQQYRIPFSDYRKQYFIGHYNPRGNHFFAFSIKDTIVKWLDPKPITYQKRAPETLDFSGYLGPNR